MAGSWHPSSVFVPSPQSGRVVPERGDPEIREVIAGPFRVVYPYRLGVVEIATVFRASRLLPDLE